MPENALCTFLSREAESTSVIGGKAKRYVGRNSFIIDDKVDAFVYPPIFVEEKGDRRATAALINTARSHSHSQTAAGIPDASAYPGSIPVQPWAASSGFDTRTGCPPNTPDPLESCEARSTARCCPAFQDS